VLYLLFALPISIADISSRKIPNIYLQLYAYAVAVLAVVRGVPDLIFMLLVFATLLLMATIGVGMGDCKLLGLIVLMLQLSRFQEFELLLLAIFMIALIQIVLIWLYSKVIPRTIAMAPAIFIGTTLYLATSQS
jgi:Flp pilus assembly protein protease CpaA